MDDRLARIGQNEAFFRAVNERLEELNQTFATVTETFRVVCECGDGTCVGQIQIPHAAYKNVRSDSALFIVQPGHVTVSAEYEVQEKPAYHVVRKHGMALRAANL